MNQFRTIDEAFAWIESFTNLEKNAREKKRHYRPERMSELLGHFGNPQLHGRVLHLAGSKGKGSTSVLLAAALSENGWKTGLYTSPHVVHYRERIQIDSSPLPDRRYIDCIAFIKEKLDISLPGETEPTTFELLTLLAFLLFKEENCDFSVIETGLGGRLDATNTVQPEACVLTPVELEHTQWLGNTLEAIASEKAGIIKEGVPVFAAPQKPEVHAVFREKAGEMKAPFYPLEEEVDGIDSRLDTNGTSFTIDYRKTGTVEGRLALTGHIQAWNAALALSLLQTLYPSVDRKIWLKGFSKATLPGRMEILSRDPLVVLDGSHTPRSVQLALESFLSLTADAENRALLFACQDDKDAQGMAEILGSSFSRVVITTPGYFKESHPQRVYRAFSQYSSSCILEEDPEKAVKAVMSESQSVLIMGSFFLAGLIKKQGVEND